MKLTLKIAKVLKRLVNGGIVTSSSAKSALIDELVAENILWEKGKHHKSIQLRDEKALITYLSNQLQINDLERYISALENKNTSRGEFVQITTDSKNSKERAFKGFLINSLHAIEAKLGNQNFTINPIIGSFIFIYDFEIFKIDKNITIVGIENSRNFRHIQEQAYLFKDINPIFISRYPQNQNKDFIKWLKSVPNNYLHFGDFDIAGIGIYLNEYKKHLTNNRCQFFIPNNIETLIMENGNRERFDKQKMNFDLNTVKEKKLFDLVRVINEKQRGLDQEYYIKHLVQ
jgi:hypothetical protein